MLRVLSCFWAEIKNADTALAYVRLKDFLSYRLKAEIITYLQPLIGVNPIQIMTCNVDTL
jgi:hypothetical protein